LKHEPIFFLAVLKAQDEGDGRILLGDNTGGGAVVCVRARVRT